MATYELPQDGAAVLATSTLLLTACLTQSEFFKLDLFGILPSGIGPRSGHSSGK